MTRSEDVILMVCMTIGAVEGFSLTAGAAVGPADGAAVGVAAGHLLRPARSPPLGTTQT